MSSAKRGGRTGRGKGAYLDQREVGDHGLDLADDLGLRGGVERLELHVEDRLLLRLLLQNYGFHAHACAFIPELRLRTNRRDVPLRPPQLVRPQALLLAPPRAWRSPGCSTVSGSDGQYECVGTTGVARNVVGAHLEKCDKVRCLEKGET